jgi:NAD+ synthetase
MKIAIAQIDTRTADIHGNVARIEHFTELAVSRGAELVVFPELAIPGYPPHDYLERTAFLDACQGAMEGLAGRTDGVGIVVGNVVRNPAESGKHVFNSACLLAEGRVIGMQHKSLLPTYDVFDECRYFEPASERQPLRFRDRAIALSVCEDVWNDKAIGGRDLYRLDPIAELMQEDVEVLLNLSASPFSIGRNTVRHAVLATAARHYRVPLFYVNLVGANDSLIFPGRSVIFRPDGNLFHQCEAFAEDLFVADTEALEPIAPPQVEDDIEDLYHALVLGIRDYAHKCGFQSAVLGLSGGIDSAVVACLAAEALGKEHVCGITMPSCYSSDASLEDARSLAETLGIRFEVIPIEPARTTYEKMLEPAFANTPPGVTEENIQARIRGIIIMAFSNKFGFLPLATGNKSELAMGYATLYGDMCGGLLVIGDVPKTMVYQLAHYINREREIIPHSILVKPPSAELRPGQKDQDTLPPYELLDRILKHYIEEHREAGEIVALGFEPHIVHDVLRRVDRAEYKRRQAAPVLRVSAKAFGLGRRLPIAQGWRRLWPHGT